MPQGERADHRDMPFLPSSLRLRRARPWRASTLPHWLPGAEPRAITAIMAGERCLAVRVESLGDERLRLTAAADDDPAELRSWRKRGLLKASQPLLVLRTSERHLLTLDQPAVPEAELAAAVRWPLAEALETEAELLLTTAVALPRINDAQRGQVLAVAGRLQPVQAQIAQLQAVGIELRTIDIVDSALRGMALLQGRGDQASVVLALVGQDLCIALVWRGQFCALRTVALPRRPGQDAAAFEEHLALNIQRTADQFERQATQLAIRHLLAALPALAPPARESVRTALPLQARLFDLAQVFDATPQALALCSGSNDLTALACVAAARLIDSGRAAVRQAEPTLARSPADLAVQALAVAADPGQLPGTGRNGPGLTDDERSLGGLDPADDNQRGTVAWS